MKTIALDFTLYEDELRESFLKGKNKELDKMNQMLKAIYNESVESLTAKYNAYEKAKNDEAIL